jgi:ferrous iron transport protein B
MSDCQGCAGCAVAEAPPTLAKSARTHVVAIIGPPNSGKSTLFNRLTGLRQKVANFPGVTVEQRVGKAKMPITTAT